MGYGDLKDLAKRAASAKVLREKAFDIAKNPKYDGYQRGLTTTVHKFFDKKSTGRGANTQAKSNAQLAKELHKSIIIFFFEKKKFILDLKTMFGVLI